MHEGKCTKRYTRQLLQDTITGIDGYPLYRRRLTEDGGQSITLNMRNNIMVDVDNRWVVPYCHVEYCNSVKSIKYICKYVNKGSDMAVFSVHNENDENINVTFLDGGKIAHSALKLPLDLHIKEAPTCNVK